MKGPLGRPPKAAAKAPAKAAPVINQPPVVDLTRPTGPPPMTTLNRDAPAKNPYPALAITPKAQKSVPNQSAKRSELDMKVKSLLVQPAAKFTEWLIQNGLVPPEQYETYPNGRSVKLKLGMFSDHKKFPNSGGYVWIADKASSSTSKYVSVFNGSLFELGLHPPTVVLKLMYHWSCQTNTQNVIQWVKVDHETINQYFQAFRSICVATVQEELGNLGGHGQVVEIGVISLGTTSSDGNRREVRVEVMGILERATGQIRLRATEPVLNMTPAKRFAQIFKPLPMWVQATSHIITDFSIDKERLRAMGFHKVTQNSAGTSRKSENNVQVMEYLKKVVPKMFQNTLSSLSTNTIQQFLDELTFRESVGHYPLLCFNNIIAKIADQTNAARSHNTALITRLSDIGAAPFDDWRITMTPPPFGFGSDALPPSMRTLEPPPVSPVVIKPVTPTPSPAPKRSADTSQDIEKLMNKKVKLATKLVDLEAYYYATLGGDEEVLGGEFKADMAFKCHLCKKLFMNNIEFMKHLSLHVESDRASAIDLADLCQCKYCFKDFDTPFAMQTHLEEFHWLKGFPFVCRICDQGFKVQNLLIHHMATVHGSSEMPYGCQICGFRSSFHRELIDHFQETHDRTDKLQCPRCLKTFSLCSDKGYNATMASSFVQHLQWHQNKKTPCKRCCLTFHNEPLLKAHIEKDHVSFKGFENLERYTYMGNETPIKMPKPLSKNFRSSARKSGLVKNPQQQTAFAAQNLEDLVMYDVDAENCNECGVRIVQRSHFNAYLCCTKCRYSTCCSKAMSIHVGIFHKTDTKPEFELGTPCLQKTDLFCCCGFQTPSGNKMAQHLSANGCRSAYPSQEEAKRAQKSLSSASFAPLISLDEDEVRSFDPNEVMAKAYMKAADSKEEKRTPNHEGPLAFLGLQMRSSVSEDDSSSKDQEPTQSAPRRRLNNGFNEEEKELNTPVDSANEEDSNMEAPNMSSASLEFPRKDFDVFSSLADESSHQESSQEHVSDSNVIMAPVTL
eukprot:maker-scaffold931_size79642-snap-gene-0.11 protein:Tk04720 transcript:maker-scaffold931_size79642-snap-gene-0.11-mRNA-1 annotation:"pogo transposable element with znf domain"